MARAAWRLLGFRGGGYIRTRRHRRTAFLERCDKIYQPQSELAVFPQRGVETVRGYAAVRYVGFAVDGEDAGFVMAFQQITETVHDNLVADNQHAFAPVFTGN